MSRLTTEQLAEVTRLINERLAEFNFPPTRTMEGSALSRGVVRLVADVIEEWQGETEQVGAWPSTPDPLAADPLVDGFHMGYQLAQQKYTRTANGHANNAPTHKAIAQAAQDMKRAVIESVAELAAAWPDMPDLQGEDVFAAAHGAPTELDEDIERELERIDDTIPTQLNGLQIIAPPASALPPASAATLGPEHTTVTPLRNGHLASVLKKPRTLSEVDAQERHKAELEAIIAHLRGLAVDGQMPSINDYHGSRPKHLPMWSTIMGRYDLATWRQMAGLCRLAYDGTARFRPQRAAEGLDDDADLDADDDTDDDDGAEAAPAKRKKPAGKREKTGRKKGYERKPGLEPRELRPTREQLVAEITQQAMGGVMPTQAQFNEAKPVVWPSATALMQRFNISWEELREEIGLKPNPRWGRTWQTAA